MYNTENSHGTKERGIEPPWNNNVIQEHLNLTKLKSSFYTIRNSIMEIKQMGY